jgi:mannitol 2-dehydrogenase
VLFVADVRPYYENQVRLLHASLSAMGYLGYLCGYRFLHEVATAPEFHAYLVGLMDDEVSPVLTSLPGMSLDGYRATLLLRFSNRSLRDPLLRICAGGSASIPRFVLPSVRGELARDGPIKNLCLCVASWLHFLTVAAGDGRPIHVVDAGAVMLGDVMRASGRDARRALGIEEIFGDLGRSQRFVEEVSSWLRALEERGARGVLAETMTATRP